MGLKTIEWLTVEKYESQRGLPKHKQIPAQNFIDWAQFGAREAQRWISIDDRETPIPNEGDLLIKLKNGAIRRYEENWQDEFGLDGIVTHWRPIERE